MTDFTSAVGCFWARKVEDGFYVYDIYVHTYIYISKTEQINVRVYFWHCSDAGPWALASNKCTSCLNAEPQLQEKVTRLSRSQGMKYPIGAKGRWSNAFCSTSTRCQSCSTLSTEPSDWPQPQVYYSLHAAQLWPLHQPQGTGPNMAPSASSNISTMCCHQCCCW